MEVEEVDLEVEFFVEEAEEAEEIAAFLRVSGIKREAELPVTTYPKLCFFLLTTCLNESFRPNMLPLDDSMNFRKLTFETRLSEFCLPIHRSDPLEVAKQ